MGNPLLTMSCQMKCGHNGTTTTMLPAPRVKLGGAPAVLAATQLTTAGCTNLIQSNAPPPTNSPNPPIPNFCMPTPLGPAHQSQRVKSMGAPLAMKGPGPATAGPAQVPIPSGTAPPPAVTTTPAPPKPISIDDAGQVKVSVM